MTLCFIITLATPTPESPNIMATQVDCVITEVHLKARDILNGKWTSLLVNNTLDAGEMVRQKTPEQVWQGCGGSVLTVVWGESNHKLLTEWLAPKTRNWSNGSESPVSVMLWEVFCWEKQSAHSVDIYRTFILVDIFEMHHLPKHDCSPRTRLHDNGILRWR